MTDIVDSANTLAQKYIDDAVAVSSCASANDIIECIDCGEDIGTTRKQALPSAVRCIDCQIKYEKSNTGHR